jgi:glucosylceramidase
MVLDRQGGPNWFKNWCIAPVIVDPDNDEVYFTPLYYTMAHFSKYIRPGAQVIDVEHTDKDLMVTAAKNPDGTIAFVIFNEGMEDKNYELRFRESVVSINLGAQSLQTVIIPTKN